MMLHKELIDKIVHNVDDVESGESASVANWVDTGNFALNKAISGDFVKGLPFGRVVDIFGDPSTGKSLLIYHLIANVQKMGGIAILDDTEDAYVKEFGQKIGINSSELIKLSSLTVEEHFEKVFTGWKDSKGKQRESLVSMILNDDPDCFILVALDSIALLSTRHEQDVKFEKPDMAKAKLIRAGLRMVSGIMRSGNILHVISNHVIAKIGVLFGPKTTTPGGSSVPFQAAVRLELSLNGKLKNKEDTGQVYGIQSEVYVAKNKVAPPFKHAVLDINFEAGVERESGLLECFVENGLLVEEESGYFSFGTERFRKGKFPEFLASHREAFGLPPIVEVK